MIFIIIKIVLDYEKLLVTFYNTPL